MYVGCNGCGQRANVDKGQPQVCKGKKQMACTRYDYILGFAQAMCLLDVYIHFYLLAGCHCAQDDTPVHIHGWNKHS